MQTKKPATSRKSQGWVGEGARTFNTPLIIHDVTLSQPVSLSLSLSPPPLSPLSPSLSPLPFSLPLSHHSLSLPLPFTDRSEKRRGSNVCWRLNAELLKGHSSILTALGRVNNRFKLCIMPCVWCFSVYNWATSSNVASCWRSSWSVRWCCVHTKCRPPERCWHDFTMCCMQDSYQMIR